MNYQNFGMFNARNASGIALSRSKESEIPPFLLCLRLGVSAERRGRVITDFHI